jgi:L-amino acid N-acyltransferase YncA
VYDIFDMQESDYTGVADGTNFDAAKLVEESADQHFAILDDRQRVRARCSIWWRDTATVDGARVGAIGHYAADDAEHAAVLLEHACRELKTRRCGYAVGPMDGNTWRRYRFVTERGTAKPFFLEPDNPDNWPQHFSCNGFDTFAHYVSELNPDFPNRKPELGNLREKFANLGVTIEPIDRACADEDMRDVYNVICEGFNESILYTPLDYEDFTRQYKPLIRTVDSRLMLVARHEGRIVGFVFSPPDFLQSGSADEIDTIVIKTVAVLPRRQYSGLGRVLIVDMLRNAEAMGYQQAISALMHTDNRSQKISADCAGPMRAYELYARRLNA